MRRAVRFLMLGCACAGLACASVLGVGDVTYASDAGPPGADGGDAATDVATDASTAPTTGCPAYPDAAFCEDFEENGTLRSVWTVVGDAGVAADDAAYSGQYVGWARTPATTGADIKSRLEHTFVTFATPNRMKIAFSFRLKQKPQSGIDLFHVDYGPDGDGVYEIVLQTSSSGATLRLEDYAYDGGAYAETPGLADLVLDTWISVLLEIDFTSDAGPLGGARMTVNGVPQVAPPLPLRIDGRAYQTSVKVGLAYVHQPNVSLAADVDDVVVWTD